MAIRNSNSSDASPALEAVETLSRDNLAAALEVLAALSTMPNLSDIVSLRADLTQVIANNEVDLSPLLTKFDEAAAAGGGGGAEPGEVRLFSLDANGQVPAGYAQVDGQGGLPVLGGLLSYLSNGKNVQGIDSSVCAPVVRPSGEVFWASGPYTYRWTKEDGFSASPMPAHPAYGTTILSLAMLPSGRVLSAGILYGSYGTTSCYAANFSTLTWNPVASISVARGQSSAVALLDGRVACIGGCSGYTPAGNSMYATTEIYNESNNTWTVGADAPVRGVGPAVRLPSGKVLWMPFSLSTDNATLVANGTRAFVYDPVANSWSETDSLPAGYTLRATSVLVRDAAGALVLHANGPQNACRYTDGNAPGTRWTSVKLDMLPPLGTAYRGGIGVQMASGEMFVPSNSTPPQIVAVQYNAGNAVVHARKL